MDAGVRMGEDVNVPIRFTIGFVNGLSGSYTGLVGEGYASDLTGRTEQEVAQHAIQLAGRLAAPASWSQGLDGPVRAALTLAIQSRRQCRLAAAGAGAGVGAGIGASIGVGPGAEAGASAGAGECIPFVDLVSRQLGVTLDTTVDQLNLGLQVSYNDRKSFVGVRSGSSQFQLTLFGEFNIEAGNFMGGGF